MENEINCRIFRHATLKSTGLPVNPHASKEELDKLVIDDKIYGCSMPFEMIRNDETETWETQKCEYK